MSGSIALAAICLIAASLLFIKLRFANTGQIDEVINSLVAADSEKVPEILEKVRELGPAAQLRLQSRDVDHRKPIEQTRIRLGLLSSEPDQVIPLRDAMLKSDLEEFMLIRSELDQYKQKLTDGLWQVATDQNAEQTQRLRASCALASYAPTNPRWNAILTRFTDDLISAR